MDHPVVDSQITFLYTADLNRTADFYTNIFGLELVLDQRTCQIFRVSCSSYLGFCQREGIEPGHSDIIFTLVTQKVDEWYEYLRSKGVNFEGPPQENLQYKIYHFFMRDPNGYLIEIQRFLDPHWSRLN